MWGWDCVWLCHCSSPGVLSEVCLTFEGWEPGVSLVELQVALSVISSTST